MRAVDAFSKYCWTYKLLQKILTDPFQLSLVLLIRENVQITQNKKLWINKVKNAFQLLHLKNRNLDLAFGKKRLPNGNDFQTRDDSSCVDMGLMRFEPDRSWVFCVNICDFESSVNKVCKWNSLEMMKLWADCCWCAAGVRWLAEL